ncbi:MAG: hydrogenase 3 maturation endopeptidase HyCI [Candidatus Bathyarchaeia archaeon]
MSDLHGGYEDVKRGLRTWLRGAEKVVILGVGSPLRRDDHIGVEVVRDLRDKVPEEVHLIECETVPENFIEPIVSLKASHLLIVDAALLNRTAGSVMLVGPDKIGGIAVSTHALPLSILCDYISRETGAKCALLAIQPKDTGFGEDLTDELKEALGRVLSLLVDALSKPQGH